MKAVNLVRFPTNSIDTKESVGLAGSDVTVKKLLVTSLPFVRSVTELINLEALPGDQGADKPITWKVTEYAGIVVSVLGTETSAKDGGDGGIGGTGG
jgi:hypothetical protein